MSIRLLLYAALMTGGNYFDSTESDQFTRSRDASHEITIGSHFQCDMAMQVCTARLVF